MASVMAIVSRKIFERDFRANGKVAGPGDTVATDHYTSSQRTLERLAEGGDLILVTVTPDEKLLRVAVLEQPAFAKDRWQSAPNAAPIADVTGLVGKLVLENGKGITARPGALAMSLQTPRVLAEADAELLRGGAGAAKSPTAAKAKAAPAHEAPKQAQPKPSAPTKPAPAAKPAPRATGDSPLARAAEYLAAGRLGAALDELLAAWATSKAPAVRELVIALGDHAARALPAIDAKPKSLDAPWRQIADAHRPVDVPRLVAAFERASSGQVLQWLDVLERFPLDPRIAAGALSVIPQFVSSSNGPTRTRAFRLIEKIADPAAPIDTAINRTKSAWNASELRERLRKIADKTPAPAALAKDDTTKAAALAKTIAALAKGPPPTAADLAGAPAKAAPRSSTSKSTTEALLRQVYDEPASDEPRSIYADALQQDGDPRGELIALQLQPKLSGALEKRVRELVKTHTSAWLGPLDAIVKDAVFERGFLQACTVALSNDAHRALLDEPAWATVEEIRTTEAAVVTAPTMRSLRRVAGLRAEEVAKLVAHDGPIAIESITEIPYTTYVGREAQKLGRNNRPAWDQIITVGALTKLVDLGIIISFDIEAQFATPADVAWVLQSKLGKQLRSLWLHFEHRLPGRTGWLAAFRANPQLERLELRRGQSTKKGHHLDEIVVIERDDPEPVVREVPYSELPRHHY